MNAVLIILLSLLLLLVGLMLLKIKLTVEASENAELYLKILFFKIKLYPKKQKKIKLKDRTKKSLMRKEQKQKRRAQKKQRKKEKTALKKKQKAQESTKETPKKKKSVGEIVDLVGLIGKLTGAFFSRFSRRLRLDITKVHITVGTEDAATTAIYYGAICSGVDVLLSILDNTTNISPKEKRDILVNADFLSSKTELDIKLSASLRVWHLFDILLSVAIKFVKEKFL